MERRPRSRFARIDGWPDAPAWIEAAAVKEGWAADLEMCRFLAKRWLGYELEQLSPMWAAAYRDKRWVAAAPINHEDSRPVVRALEALSRWEKWYDAQPERMREEAVRRAGHPPGDPPPQQS